ELARGLRPMRRHFDVDFDRTIARRIEEPNVSPALINDALAVGLSVPRVVVVVIGMSAQARAVWKAGVEIAYALAIGQEVDAAADPHRARDIALELRHPAEISRAFGINPKMSCGSAAIALPSCRVRGVAADHHRAARSVRKMIDLPQG